MTKRLLVILDGASEPVTGDTHSALTDAALDNIDQLARCSLCGTAWTAPKGVQPDSLVCLLGILGISSTSYGVMGRAALEATAHGVTLTSGDSVLRCNLVRVVDGTLVDFTGAVPSQTAEQIAKSLTRTLPMLRVGQAYRHFLLPEDTFEVLSSIHFSEPHEHTGEPICDLLPWSESAEAQSAVCSLHKLMEISAHLCTGFGYDGLMLWPWGLSHMPRLPAFASLYGTSGACVCGIDLMDGIARALSLEAIRPDGATGDCNTDLAAKATSVLELLSRYDFVLVHINGADEAAHSRNPQLKRDFIERVDELFFGPLLARLQAGTDPYRILLCTDHHTSPQDGRHKAGMIPFLLYDSDHERLGVQHFDEGSAVATGYQTEVPLTPLLLCENCSKRSPDSHPLLSQDDNIE